MLGLPPGPLVGQAWRHLKELRLDRGPLPHDEAVAELSRWAAGTGTLARRAGQRRTARP